MIQMKNLLALHIHTHVLLYNWPSTAQEFNLPSKLSKIPIITGQLALHICGPTSTGSANYGTCSSVCAGSHVCLCVPPRTAAHQAPLSQGFSRQEHWSGLPCPLPGDLLSPESESPSLTSPALAGRFFTCLGCPAPPGEPCSSIVRIHWKKSHVSGLLQVKPVFFKGRLYIHTQLHTHDYTCIRFCMIAPTYHERICQLFLREVHVSICWRTFLE